MPWPNLANIAWRDYRKRFRIRRLDHFEEKDKLAKLLEYGRWVVVAKTNDLSGFNRIFSTTLHLDEIYKIISSDPRFSPVLNIVVDGVHITLFKKGSQI